MNVLTISLLIVTSGLAIVAQNAIMMRASGALGGIVPALWLNSIVGLAALSVPLVLSGGLQTIAGALRTGAWAFLLPGLLGTYYVACSLAGYRTLGAAVTISLLVASQLIAGISFDYARSGNLSASQIIGAVLLVSGVGLVSNGY